MIFLLLLFLISLAPLHASTDADSSTFSTKRWKSMPIEDTNAWDEFIQEMRNNNTCPCECIKKINEEKKDKALKRLLLNDDEIKEVQDAIHDLESKPEQLLHLTFADNIPGYIRVLTAATAKIMNMQGNINVRYGKINGIKLNDMDGNDLVMHPSYYPAEHYFDISLMRMQCATLHHEFMHIKKKHLEIDNYILHYILKRSRGNHANAFLAGMYLRYHRISTQRSTQKDIDDINKLRRAHESEADREQAACGTRSEAKNAYLYWQFSVEQRKNIPPEHLVDPIHPPIQKRLLWATLILKAKEAEYRLDHPYRQKVKQLWYTTKRNITLCKASVIGYLNAIMTYIYPHEQFYFSFFEKVSTSIRLA